jgi:dTDP-glucose 4,6-dehydratase
MRVLITGSSGFVGHYIVKNLVEKAEVTDVVGLERLTYSGDLSRPYEILADSENRKKYSVIHHDLRSEIGDILNNRLGQFDYIIHVGASTHVDRSITDPMSFVLDNVVATCNILNFARKQTNLKKFIYFSTDEVFGPAAPGIYHDEYDVYNSGNPYSATKAGGEELAVAFRNTFKVPVYITHTMNIFGPRQHPEKYVPMCIKKIFNGETIFIHSDSTKTIPGSRFYIHLEDVASAIWFVMNIQDDVQFPAGKCPKLNIVGKEETTNLELAQYVADALSKPLHYEFVDFHSSRPGHDLRYALSGKRMESMGWVPANTISERITEVVKWYLANPMWLS